MPGNEKRPEREPPVSTVAEIMFWGSLALLVYPYAGYPLLVALLAVLFPRLKSDPERLPSVSVLIAAYNEQASIGGKVRELLESDYPPEKLQVVVVSDGSTDLTDEIMRALSGPRVHFYRLPRGGKTAAQNFGVTQCSGEIVVFSDATARYEPDAIRQLVALYADPRVGAVSGVCRFSESRPGRSPTGLGQILYGGYEQAIRVFQSRIWTATACSGPIYSVRREWYVPLPPHACGDMVEALEIVRRGHRVVYAERATAWEGTTQSAGEEFRMRVRVVSQGIAGLISAGELLWSPRRAWVAFQLISHKLLRYLMPVWLLLLLAGNAALVSQRGWMLYPLLAQASFYGLALVSLRLPLHRRSKVLGLPLHLCTLSAAIVAGALEAARGHTFAVWETVRR